MKLRRFAALAAICGAALALLGVSGARRATISQVNASSDFTNFESDPVHPICLSPDGKRLFALNVADARLSVFDVTPTGLIPVDEIPVGLEPVSLAARSANEVWVVDHLSDDVSIVDVNAGNVVKTLHVGDEPTDVVFAGTAGNDFAYVCLSQPDQIRAFNAATLTPVGLPIPVFSEDPRALAVSPDRSKVYAAAFE